MSLWPPFRGAGIRVRHVARDWREVRVEPNLGVHVFRRAAGADSER
jgi:hypothetical protein